MCDPEKITPISLNLTTEELEELEEFIIRHSWVRDEPKNEYELLRVKDDKVGIIVYKSGKLVHNGSEESKRVLREVLRSEKDYDYLLGSDETGKGEWYGPLVVCCIALEPPLLDAIRMMGVRDSKTLNIDKIMDLSAGILKLEPVYNTVVLPPETYNKLYKEFRVEEKNLNDLLAWAHSRAIKDTLDELTYKKVKLVIDRFDIEKTYRRLYSLDEKKIEIIQKAKGESESPVAAASILAKRIYEEQVDKLNKIYQINLRETRPEDLEPSILPKVAKTHFKNIRGLI
jgi:ribonuclease HIII